MRVFLSWSGHYTRDIAEIFDDWLPCVVQSISCFISSGDIQAGERWQSKINAALMDIDFGIVFVTKENKDAPWIMFESGALAKNLDASRVVPVLCDASEIDFSKSPLLQFQYVQLSKEGVFSLMRSIYSSLDGQRIDQKVFEQALQTWWPQLEAKLSNIKPETKIKSKTEQITSDDRLERLEDAVSSLIGLTRSMAKSLEEQEVSRHVRGGVAWGTMSRDGRYVANISEGKLMSFIKRIDQAADRKEVMEVINEVQEFIGTDRDRVENIMNIARNRLKDMQGA